MFLPPDVLEEKQVDTQYISSELDVIYEDENILIVNKPYGLLSQSDQSKTQDCLVNRVQAYLMEKTSMIQIRNILLLQVFVIDWIEIRQV